MGLRALLPDRPRVFLRNFRAAQTLSGETVQTVTAPVLEANKLLPALHSGEAWPEEAIRHAVAILHVTTVDVNGPEQVGLGSIKRPAGELGFNPPDWKRLRIERKNVTFFNEHHIRIQNLCDRHYIISAEFFGSLMSFKSFIVYVSLLVSH